MGANDAMNRSRREFLRMAGAAAAGLILPGGPFAAEAAPIAAGRAMKIGIIGSGRIGGALGGHWARAGHEVLLSARNLGPVRKLVAEIGHKARAGTPRGAVTTRPS